MLAHDYNRRQHEDGERCDYGSFDFLSGSHDVSPWFFSRNRMSPADVKVIAGSAPQVASKVLTSAADSAVIRRMNAGIVLDRIDRRILVNLQADGRLTNQALADRVALSPSACLARVRRLESAGFIQGYHARLDPFMIDVGVVLFAEVTLKGHGEAEFDRFDRAIDGIPQIVEASHVSGEYDYLLKVVVADLTEWTRIAGQLTGAAVGADRINTHVLLRKPKIFVGYPVGTHR